MDGDKPVALLDMDGTVCDYHGALEKGLKEVFGTPIVPSLREKVEGLIKSQTGWYRTLVPLPLGLAIYKTLREVGFQIVICSKGSRWSVNSWSEKMQWVIEHLDDDVLVNLTQVKPIVYGRVFVDDYPNHFLPWLERRPRGIVIVPDQPWNQDLEGTMKEFRNGGMKLQGAEERIHRVKTMDDIPKIRPILEKAYSR